MTHLDSPSAHSVLVLQTLEALADVHLCAKTAVTFVPHTQMDYETFPAKPVIGGGVGFGVKAYYSGNLIATVTAVAPVWSSRSNVRSPMILTKFQCDYALTTARAAKHYADMVSAFAQLVEDWEPAAKRAISDLTCNIGKLSVDASTIAHTFAGQTEDRPTLFGRTVMIPPDISALKESTYAEYLAGEKHTR